MSQLIIGADIGGTSTKVAVADLDSGVLGVAIGGPGNPNAAGLDQSAVTIRQTIAAALSSAGVDRAEDLSAVEAVVIGMAGESRIAGDQAYRAALLPVGLSVSASIVPDLSIAFSAGSPAEEGYVLIAGTGAIAGHIRGDSVMERRDGWGWLIGDGGSGFWLGREAVRATLTTLDRTQQPSDFQRAVLHAAGATDAHSLINSCYATAPVGLARFAPLVVEHAESDATAATICDLAADQLAQTLLDLRPDATSPVVIGGSVLAGSGPIWTRFSALVGAAGITGPRPTGSGVVGALWSGARRLGRADLSLHQLLSMTAATANVSTTR